MYFCVCWGVAYLKGFNMPQAGSKQNSSQLKQVLKFITLDRPHSSRNCQAEDSMPIQRIYAHAGFEMCLHLATNFWLNEANSGEKGVYAHVSERVMEVQGREREKERQREGESAL